MMADIRREIAKRIMSDNEQLRRDKMYNRITIENLRQRNEILMKLAKELSYQVEILQHQLEMKRKDAA